MLKGLFLLTIDMFLLFFFQDCNNNNNKDELQFYYYPSLNVYYNPAKKDFLYSLNGTKTWSKFETNNTEPATLGKKVVVYSKNEDVYRDNENHRKLYGGKLLNLDLQANYLAVTGPEVAERKKNQKKVVTYKNNSVTNKHKNKIGRFISKIFGKHR